MLRWLEKLYPAILAAFCFCLILHPSTVISETGVSYEIADMKSTLSDTTLNYTVMGSTPPIINVSERFAPFRIVIDVAGGFFGKSVSSSATKIPENSFSSLKISGIKNQTPQVMRFEFTLADSHDYKVKTVGNNIQIAFFPANGKNSTPNPVDTQLQALTDFKISSTPNSTTITIISNREIENYTVDTIGSGVNRPPRMYIDIEDVAITELVREKQIGTSVEKLRVAPRGKGVRIVFDSASQELFRYSVAPSPMGLEVIIDETTEPPKIAMNASTTSKKANQSDATLDELIDSSENLLTQDPKQIDKSSTEAKIAAIEEDFSLSGYKKQKISVDFYKIDIHNVFRLFRQITDLNIIVDEEVSGALTLALSDVPWDFALDIILNLMDLRKEERFNTIVIYPNKKEFAWPTRAEDNLSIEADIEVIEEDALIIEKSANLTKEVLKAKEFMLKAASNEKNDDFEDAVGLYLNAHKLWPDNSKLTNRIASIYLVNLGMNAKAVHYAKKSLKSNPKDNKAALLAAIGSANMKRIAEAKEYFTQSISDSPPMKEALMSFSAFSENNNLNDVALKLLDKYHSYYGENLNTMVAKARILDKIGLRKDATNQYKAVLSSGFRMRPDLRKYIEGRVASKKLK